MSLNTPITTIGNVILAPLTIRRNVMDVKLFSDTAKILPSENPPEDTSVVWLDTTDNTLNVWRGGAWAEVS